MSRMVLFAVKDCAARAFNVPFSMRSAAEAVRSFTDEVNRPADDNVMNRHPGDFELYRLGEFSQIDGKLESEGPVLVVRAADVVRVVESRAHAVAE